MSVMDAIVGILTIVTLSSTLIGLLVRFMLLPWLRQHLVEPVLETQRQITVNHHVSDPPTLLDKLDALTEHVAALDDKCDVQFAWANYETRRIWAVIRQDEMENKNDQAQPS